MQALPKMEALCTKSPDHVLNTKHTRPTIALIGTHVLEHQLTVLSHAAVLE